MNRGSAEKSAWTVSGGENMDSNNNYDLIVKNAMIYTMDREGRVIRRGSAAVRGDRIALILEGELPESAQAGLCAFLLTKPSRRCFADPRFVAPSIRVEEAVESLPVFLRRGQGSVPESQTHFI